MVVANFKNVNYKCFFFKKMSVNDYLRAKSQIDS